MKFVPLLKPAAAGAILSCLMLGAAAQTPPAPASAGAAAERESLEALRETTLALIELLVAQGTLTREKADQLLAEARRRAADRVAQAGTPAAGQWGAPPPAPAPAGPVTRVPYVPQVVRDQIRNELREEIVARARAERWGVPNATAEWTERVLITGDLRVRGQGDFYGDDNLSPLEFVGASAATLATRAPDLAAANANGQPTANTLVDRNRSRLRARLGVTARVADGVTAGLRLATGSPVQRVETALEQAAPPMTATTLILLAGLVVTLFSALPGLATYGALIALAVGLALLADLFLLPGLLRWILK